MSKGSNRRPTQVDYKTYQSNWDNIFGKKDKKQTNSQPRGADNDNQTETSKEVSANV